MTDEAVRALAEELADDIRVATQHRCPCDACELLPIARRILALEERIDKLSAALRSAVGRCGCDIGRAESDWRVLAREVLEDQ
jgi:hypothetical protein